MKGKEIIASKIRNKELLEAFLRVNREEFLPPHLKRYAYDERFLDMPLQITSKITTTALSLGIYMLDSLELRKGQRVLEIGTGIGYYTALIAEIVDRVYTMEIDDQMYEYAKKVLAKYKNVEVIKGDGTQGLEREKPFDRIVVWAAFPTLPCKLYDQLRDGGIMIVPIGTERIQKLYKVIKGKEAELRVLTEVVFMKAKGLYGFYEEEEDDLKVI